MKDVLAVIALSVFGFVLYGAMTGDKHSDCSIAAKMTGVCIEQKAKLAREAEEAQKRPTKEKVAYCDQYARAIGSVIDDRDSGVPLTYFTARKGTFGFMMSDIELIYGWFDNHSKGQLVKTFRNACLYDR